VWEEEEFILGEYPCQRDLILRDMRRLLNMRRLKWGMW